LRAVVWHGRGDVRVEDVAEAPPPGRDEVMVAVEWCGICGTDLEEWRHGPRFVPVGEPHPVTGRKAPIVLGHEVSGRVAEVGPAVTDLREGDLVALLRPVLVVSSPSRHALSAARRDRAERRRRPRRGSHRPGPDVHPGT
jgi:threonine dehydrogenase-like Zn-dependent dehydrogenase